MTFCEGAFKSRRLVPLPATVRKLLLLLESHLEPVLRTWGPQSLQISNLLASATSTFLSHNTVLAFWRFSHKLINHTFILACNTTMGLAAGGGCCSDPVNLFAWLIKHSQEDRNSTFTASLCLWSSASRGDRQTKAHCSKASSGKQESVLEPADQLYIVSALHDE